MTDETTEDIRICISCKKPVKKNAHYLSGGTEFFGDPGYGSGFDSITQEPSEDWPERPERGPEERLLHSHRTLSIVICDECLEDQAAEFVTVTHTYMVGRETTTMTPWVESDHTKQNRAKALG